MADQKIEAVYPLTPLQKGMLFHSLYSPQAGMYVQQMVGELHENLNVLAFQQAWQRTGERHSVLRTGFLLESPDEPLQAVYRQLLFPYEERDWRHLPVTEQQQGLDDYLEVDRRRGFDLTKAPLMRLALFRMGEQEFRLVWTSHHALLDGRSRLLLLQELFAFYEAFCRGEDLPLEAPRPFRDYIEWLTKRDFSKAERFWKFELKGASTPTPFGIDSSVIPRPDGNEEYGCQTIQLSRQLTLMLQRLAEEHRLTLNTLFQGAWALLLSNYSGSEDVVFGATRACRHSTIEGAESMVGLFINTVPVRVGVPADIALLPWLKKLRAQWVRMRDYEHTPLSMIQECGPHRGSSLFESLLVFENYELNSSLRDQGRGFENREFRLFGRTNYPLTITSCLDRHLLLKIEYHCRRFSESSIERLLGHFETLLQAMSSDPQRQLCELPILTQKEKKQVLVEWNSTSVPYPRQQCVHELFEAQAEKTPDALALVFEDGGLTYQELNARANQLAQFLKKLGVEAETLVGVCLERSPNLIVAMLGVLKAGGAYVPIDPDYPRERKSFMMADTGMKVLLTESRQLESLPNHEAAVVCLDSDWDIIAAEGVRNSTCCTNSSNLAYVIYTSGSTGHPKGVAIPHRGIIRLLWNVDYVHLGSHERFLHLSSISFDASTFEVWGALLHGAQLVIFPDRVPTLQGLERVLKEHEISVLWLTSSLFNLVIDESPEILRGVRQLLTGGEALSVRHVVQALEALPNTQIINGYGPTESTTFACCYPIPRDFSQHATNVPIGRPISNTRTFVLDSSLRPVPIGITGEIYIGGDGLARGYLNQPELTAEKFIRDPFSEEPDTRLYRTGDLARFLPDGNIEFCGRRDDQVKIRGFRIELGEIEATLKGYPSVKRAVVIASQDPDGLKSLIAYLVAMDRQSPPSVNELRNFLEMKLPDYMIPARFLFLDRIPLTPNGKVDRHRLPTPGPAEADKEEILVQPRSPVEEKLATIWRQVLGSERIGIYDNFFDLGGDSLLAVRVVSRLRGTLGIDLTVRKLFDEPTIARLAEWIEHQQSKGQPSLEMPLRAVPRNQEIPIFVTQEHFWKNKSIYLDNAVGNIGRILRLRGSLQISALRWAFNDLVARHEPLRTSFALSPTGKPIQVIHQEQNIEIPVIDLGGIPAAAREREARRLAEEEVMVPFRFSEGSLLRVKLFRLATDEHWLVCSIHHLVADGWSLKVFFHEMGDIYTAYLRGETPDLPVLPIQFADYSVWHQQNMQGEYREKLVAYWTKRLGGDFSNLKLPLDHPRPKKPKFLARREIAFLPAELQKSICRLGLKQQCSEFMVLLSAFNLQLHRHSGQADIAVASTVANRDLPETVNTIGWYANPVLFRCNLSGNPSFLELLKRVQEVVLEGCQNQGLSLVELMNLSNWKDDSTVHPMYQYQFIEEPDCSLERGMGDLIVEFLPREQARTKADLRVFVGKTGQRTEVKFDYNVDIFETETIRLILDQYLSLLRQIVQNPAQRLSDYSLLDTRQLKVAQTLDCVYGTLLSNQHTNANFLQSMPTIQSRTGKYPPLSFAQQRLWFLDQLEPGNSAYNINQLLRLKGPLHLDALHKALNAVVDRQEALRTTFSTREGEPVQIIAPRLELPLPIIELEGISDEERTIEAQRKAEGEAGRPFDLSRGPLFRAFLYRLKAEEHLLLLSMHHIVSDGWSMVVLQRELSAFYIAFSTGKSPQLPELPVQYADYAIWQRQWLQGKSLEAQLAYWKQQLNGCVSVLRLPTDRLRPETQTYQGARQMGILPRTLVDSLENMSRREGCTLFMILLTAFKTLLYRLTRQEDIVVGVPVAGRTQPETEGLIGFFVNTLALRSNVSGDPSFLTLLHHVRDCALDAYAHQNFPFDKLVEELNPERSLSHTPLFQVMLNVWSLPPYKLQFPGLNVEIVTRTEAQSKFDLTLYAWEQDRGYTLSLVYNANLFEQTRMVEFLRQLRCLLEQIAQNPAKSIRSYSLVTPQFKSLLPDPILELDEPPYELVHRRFLAQAEKSPDHPAICQGHRTWKYQELADCASLCARVLVGAGIQRGEVVAVTGPKSYGLVSSMMGVLMSGGVLLPLDLDLPPNRQRLLIQESRARHILYVGQWRQEDNWIRELLPTGVLSVDPATGQLSGAARPSDFSIQNLPELSPNDPAYIFFTSGTSGVPKGVLGCHKGVSHFLSWQQETFAVGLQDRSAQLTNLSFDVVLRDIFLPLISGATLYLPEGSDVEQALLWLDRQKITVLHAVPSLAERWLSVGHENVKLENLRCIFFAGETLTELLVRRWREAFPYSGQIINLYGPTETTMVKCFYIVPSELPAGVLPVGRPLPESQALLLSENQQLCGLGEPGEIVIRTPFRTLGYINADEEQHKRFAPNPFRGDPDDVVYFTGDQGRYLPDGSLEILGRLDDQVKIRGLRVEPAEVTAVLSLHPAIRSCVVVATKNRQMESVLVAYVVPSSPKLVTTSELKSYASKQLPSAMVPSAVVFLQELPLMPNGKVNRSALPPPEWSELSSLNHYSAPRNPLEEMLARIWCQGLGLKQIGVDDNFFDLGGHSLLAMKLSSKMSAATHRDISVRSLFLYPSIAEIADALESFPLLNGGSEIKSGSLQSERKTATPTAPPTLPLSAPGLRIERRSLLSLLGTGKIAPVDAVAVNCLPNLLLAGNPVSKDEVINDWYEGLPALNAITETSLGRIGIITIPRFRSDIYVNAEDLVDLIVEALELAHRIGARAVSFTGLIPSATEYGHAVARRIVGRPDLPMITTGHATTAAAVVLAVRRILEESGRNLTRERIGFLGLGSIGTATLRLLLRCLPHPAEIILCDIYSKMFSLESIKKDLVDGLSFKGLIRTASVTSRVPREFYDASLIVGATNVPEVLDLDLVKGGTLIVDDSAPHCFNTEEAVQRFLTHGDILFCEGGTLKSPDSVTQLRHIDQRSEQKAARFYNELIARFRPNRITGCVLSSLLSARFETAEPTLGLVDDDAALQHYRQLEALGFRAYDLHCDSYLVPQAGIGSFSRRFGRVAVDEEALSQIGTISFAAKAESSPNSD